jgi:uncharacterized protein YbbC (DUF1343 family)
MLDGSPADDVAEFVAELFVVELTFCGTATANWVLFAGLPSEIAGRLELSVEFVVIMPKSAMDSVGEVGKIDSAKITCPRAAKNATYPIIRKIGLTTHFLAILWTKLFSCNRLIGFCKLLGWKVLLPKAAA